MSQTRRYEIGERVIASAHGTGYPRAGVVTARINEGGASYLWNGECRYMVKFDRDHGPSGPCVVFRAEGEREDVYPATGTAA